MKRILSILMILLIVSMIVITPIAEDKPRATTDYGYLLSQFSPTFWVWWTQAIGSMGLMGSDLGTQLDYINRNGQIDQYFANVWDRFETDVETNWGYLTGYLNMTGQLWKDLFAGDPLAQFKSVQEIYNDSQDPNSDYYIPEPSKYIGDIKVGTIESNSLLNTIYDSFATFPEKLAWCNLYPNMEVTYSGFRYYIETTTSYVYFKKQNLTTMAITLIGQVENNLSGYTNLGKGYTSWINYINADGSLDANGNKYKFVILPYAIFKNLSNGNYAHWLANYDIVLDSTIRPDELTDEISPVEFNPDILDNTITDEDITPDDYVHYEIHRAYLEQIQELITKISMNEDTQADWVLNPPQEVVRVETTNTVIREIIQAGDATIPVELDFPELQDLELPSALITKFPFCIPYDFYRFFQMLNAEPVAPEFTIPFVIGDVIDYDFVFNFDMFDDIIYIVRWFFLALFVLGLIMATRQMIKG